jgi:TonB family protein
MKLDRLSYSTPFAVEGDPLNIVCHWDAPDGSQRVTLNPSLIRELRKSAIEAFLAIPRRGIELGGLLFGQVRMDSAVDGRSETAVFEVAAFEDIPCEHRFGPSYTLDDLDRNQLAERLARHQRDGSPPVVGFYRSYTGREARLDLADQELIRTFFPHRRFACLLLQPLSMEKCAAGFQFCGDGEISPEPAYTPFPFEAAQMKQEVVEPPDGPRPARPLPEVVRITEEEPAESQNEIRLPPPHLTFGQPEDAPASLPSAHRFRFLLPLLFCILAAIASVAIYELWKTTREPRWVPLGLDAQPSVRELELRWNGTAPAVAQAKRGVLAVTDGPTPHEISLSPEQLHRGSFSYSPWHSSLLFQLRLYDEQSPVAADSLRVIRLPDAAPVTASVPADEPAARPPAPLPKARPSTPLAVLHEVQPVISDGIRARIQVPKVVPVQVTVDPSGHVTHASAKVTGGGLERYLADVAVKAARQWSFAPARSQDGSPVAATKTISFEFRPPGR